jgi:hypothetical protein
LALALVAACSDPPPPVTPAPAERSAGAPAGVALATPAVTAYTGPPRGAGAMPGVRPTKMADALSKAGLDPKNLPPLESLAPGPKQRVMRTFTESLGVPCVGCHAEDDFRADTRRKRVSRRMWDQLVRVLQTDDGQPVYCDSCHTGALFHLDRHDPKVVAAYMGETMVGRLRRADGRTHDCTTCHGDPPDFQLLETWKGRAAPNIVPAGAPSADVPDWPIEGVRAPVDCGPRGETCPLAARMRLAIAPMASRFDDPEALAKALEGVARFAPESPSFVAAAKRAAQAARSRDRAALRAACAGCHAEHKASWRSTHRGAAEAGK